MASNLPLAHGGDIPELDVLQIPHSIRHGAIHSASPTSRVLNAP